MTPVGGLTGRRSPASFSNDPLFHRKNVSVVGGVKCCEKKNTAEFLG